MLILAASAFAAMSLPRTVLVDDLPRWPGPGESRTVELSVSPGLPFREAILSWNVAEIGESRLELAARAGSGPWRSIGYWSGATRSSAPVVRDAEGAVLTDIVRTTQPAEALEIRLTLRRAPAGPEPRFKLLTVCFDGDRARADAELQGIGKILTVPKVFQMAYPRGNVLCSPASLVMVLGYWAAREGRPDWRKEVPEIEAGVWDPEYAGAGNWSFNAAFAGSVPGMTGFVARLESLGELQAWTDAGVPVVASVALSLLRGRELSGKESGHLVVVRGVTEDGSVELNDPATEAVAIQVSALHFQRAWDYSRRTVYLVFPENAARPAAPEGRWP